MLYNKGIIQNIKNNNTLMNSYKIKDIFKITRGTVIPKNSITANCDSVNKYPVYSSQTSNDGILGYDKDYDFDGKYLTWTTDGANAGKVFFRNGKFRCTNVCGILYNDNDLFINQLTANLLNYETPKHVSYVGNPKLMNNIMAEITLSLPDYNFSTSIHLLLLKLQNQNNLNEINLSKLILLKKGLLQQMFV